MLPGRSKSTSFGKNRFRDLILSVQRLPFSDQKGRIVETLHDYQGSEVRRDDVSVIGFKII